MEDISDILLYAMFIAPLITIPIVWKLSNQNGLKKILIALALAIALSALFGFIAILSMDVIPNQS